ncbi:MAG: hypothetical protein ACI9O3_000142 [Colwellia sp.]|jgi:hypothetical protein
MRTIKLLLTTLLVVSSYSFADNVQCSKGRCVNGDTDASWGLTFTPSFKNLYPINLINTDKECNDSSATPTNIPRNTYFKQTLDHNAQIDEEKIVHVYNVDLKTDKSTTTSTYFNKPFKFCLTENNKVEKSNYIRVGGLNTGLLVIPYKLRKGDIYSDSAIGPYISYKRETFELLAAFGLSKISVSEVGTDKVETEDGLTLALGVNFEISKNWDIALIVGVDHLSGSKGDDWEFQDEPWVSFAIGYSFTR